MFVESTLFNTNEQFSLHSILLTFRCCNTPFGVTSLLFPDDDDVVTVVVALTLFSRVLARYATMMHNTVVIAEKIKNKVVVPVKFPCKELLSILFQRYCNISNLDVIISVNTHCSNHCITSG